MADVWRLQARDAAFRDRVAQALDIRLNQAGELIEQFLACPSLRPDDLQELTTGTYETVALLIEVIRERQQDVGLLDEVFQKIFPHPVPLARLARLRLSLRWLRPLALEHLPWLYYRCAPRFWHFPEEPGGQRALERAVVQLASAPIQSSAGPWHPLLRFVAALAEYAVDDTAASALRAWVAEEATRLGIPPRAQGLDLAAQSPVLPLHLLVEVADDSFRPCGYRVQAWLFKGDDLERLSDGDDGPVRLEELSTVVDPLLRKAEAWIVPTTDTPLTVEFALPANLVDLAIDQLPVTVGPQRTASLGSRFPVTVRLMERNYDPSHRANWMRFHRLFDALLEDNPNQVLWVNGEADCEWDSLAIGLLEDRILCLALGRPFNALSAPSQENIIHALYEAGTPIALWARGRSAPRDHSAEIRRLVDGGLRNLPETVCRLRQEAAKSQDPSHLGHDLMLLWDNPNRALPEFVFTSPL
jgi:hypothetical protein